MPDNRMHRGQHPADEKLFGETMDTEHPASGCGLFAFAEQRLCGKKLAEACGRPIHTDRKTAISGDAKRVFG